MKEPVDKLFNRKLQDLEVHPSPAGWTQLEGVLNEDKAKKKVRAWYYVAAAVAMLAVTSGIWVVSQNQVVEPASVLAQHTPTQDVPEQTPALTPVVEKVHSPVQQQASIVASVNNDLRQEQDLVVQETLLTPEPMLRITARRPILTTHQASLQLDFYPMYVEDIHIDESRLEKAWQYAKRLKNGEENLLNLRKAKEDLFAFAKNKIKPEDNSQLNLD